MRRDLAQQLSCLLEVTKPHPATSNIDDCNFNHYSLQLSFYRYILERYYGLNVGSQTLFHLKENRYEIFPINYHEEELINMLREKELI